MVELAPISSRPVSPPTRLRSERSACASSAETRELKASSTLPAAVRRMPRLGRRSKRTIPRLRSRSDSRFEAAGCDRCRRRAPTVMLPASAMAWNSARLCGSMAFPSWMIAAFHIHDVENAARPDEDSMKHAGRGCQAGKARFEGGARDRSLPP